MRAGSSRYGHVGIDWSESRAEGVEPAHRPGGLSVYRARQNEIVDSEGRQVAVVLPTSCSKKAAREMAAYCAQQMNHAERGKAIRAEQASKVREG